MSGRLKQERQALAMLRILLLVAKRWRRSRKQRPDRNIGKDIFEQLVRLLRAVRMSNKQPANWMFKLVLKYSEAHGPWPDDVLVSANGKWAVDDPYPPASLNWCSRRCVAAECAITVPTCCAHRRNLPQPYGPPCRHTCPPWPPPSTYSRAAAECAAALAIDPHHLMDPDGAALGCTSCPLDMEREVRTGLQRYPYCASLSRRF